MWVSCSGGAFTRCAAAAAATGASITAHLRSRVNALAALAAHRGGGCDADTMVAAAAAAMVVVRLVGSGAARTRHAHNLRHK